MIIGCIAHLGKERFLEKKSDVMYVPKNQTMSFFTKTKILQSYCEENY